MRFLVAALLAFVVTAVAVTGPASAQTQERRFAFVVGNESYADGALPTAANDAGLVAQTLEAAGFEVVGARDLDAETLRQSYGDFLKRVTDAGKDAVAFVYLSGYGLQYGSDNYYLPIGATLSRAADIPIQAIRLSDLVGPLNALDLKARFLVFDAAYRLPVQPAGPPLAGGLSIIEPVPGSLLAYNTAPGTVAPVGKGNYGAYAQALAAELREGGLPPDEIFDRTRLRVDAASKGAEVPWDSSKIDSGFRFFDRGPDAPQVAAERKPSDASPVQQAYVAALSRDTVRSYSEFATTYSRDPLAKRARILLAARREAITWSRTIAVDTPPAYWSYLGRYPRGPHVEAARLRLAQLAAAFEPPAGFAAIPYDVPPPPSDEIAFVDAPVVYLDDPAYDLGPPPPVDEWLPPVPVGFLDLPPPPPPLGLFFLPVPAFVPLAAYINPSPRVVLPQGNRFFAGGDRGGAIHRPFAAGDRGAVEIALPAAAAQRAAVFEKRGITTPGALDAARRHPGGIEMAPGAGRGPASDQRLPGIGAGHALPPGAGVRDPGRQPGGRDGGPRDQPHGEGRDDRGVREPGVNSANPDARHGGGQPERHGPRNEGARDRGDAARGADRPREHGREARPDRGLESAHPPRSPGTGGREGREGPRGGDRREGAGQGGPHAPAIERRPGGMERQPGMGGGGRPPGMGREPGIGGAGMGHGGGPAPMRPGGGPGFGGPGFGGPRGGGPGPMMHQGGGPGMGGAPHGPGMGGGGPHGAPGGGAPHAGGGPVGGSHGGGPGGGGPGRL